VKGWIEFLGLQPKNRIISISGIGDLKEWDTETLKGFHITNIEGSPILSTLVLNDSRITCSTYDNIKVYNPEANYSCDKTIQMEGYSNYQKLLLLSDGNLASSVTYKRKICIMILNCNNNFNCIKILNSQLIHLNAIIELSYDKFILCSPLDKNIFISLVRGKELEGLKVLNKHKRSVSALLLIKRYNLLVSGSIDRTAKVWDLLGHKCIKTLTHGDAINKLLLLLPNSNFVSCQYDGVIHIFNVLKFKCINTLKFTSSCSALLLLKDNNLVVALNDCSMILLGY
jgi:WD40 repeat protein